MDGDLPRMANIDEVSMQATVDAMQAQGPQLRKVDQKALVDNCLLKTIETEGFLEKIKAR